MTRITDTALGKRPVHRSLADFETQLQRARHRARRDEVLPQESADRLGDAAVPSILGAHTTHRLSLVAGQGVGDRLELVADHAPTVDHVADAASSGACLSGMTWGESGTNSRQSSDGDRRRRLLELIDQMVARGLVDATRTLYGNSLSVSVLLRGQGWLGVELIQERHRMRLVISKQGSACRPSDDLATDKRLLELRRYLGDRHPQLAIEIVCPPAAQSGNRLVLD